MADAAKPIFNEKAASKLRSPDDLDKYIRVTNPSVWVILIACIALVLGLLAWGLFGAVVSGVNAKGTLFGETVVCFLSPDEADHVAKGNVANVEGVTMHVIAVERSPMSRAEVQELLGSDYLTSAIVEADWVYPIVLEGDVSGFSADVPIDVNITVEQISPISLVLGG